MGGMVARHRNGVNAGFALQMNASLYFRCEKRGTGNSPASEFSLFEPGFRSCNFEWSVLNVCFHSIEL